MNNNSEFHYTYSAKQCEEIQAIRDKYLPQSESKLDELKRLDRCVHSAGLTQSLIVGVLGCLIFGTGLCFAMQVVGQSVALGVFIGVWGVAVMIAAYPLHRSLVRKAKEKHQSRILELAAELCGETALNQQDSL